MTYILPGDPVLTMLDVQYTQEEYDQMEAYLGLDKPVAVQFFDCLGGVLQLDLGRSIHSAEAVLAIPIGIISALKQNTRFDFF